MALCAAALIRALNFAPLAQDLNLVTSSLAARALAYFWMLDGLTLPVLFMLNEDARPAAWGGRSRRRCGAKSNEGLERHLPLRCGLKSSHPCGGCSDDAQPRR